ncbi:MAG: class I SAM-dependent methyltransferase [Steroidobacteraceae bacterium]
MIEPDLINHVYKNDGNEPLIGLMDIQSPEILDVGCGAGDNAALVSTRFPGSKVDGITHSRAEADSATAHMRDCWVFDIEGEWPEALKSRKYDALLFSHVLEHLREPAAIVAAYCSLLKENGIVLIAVPNILSWRLRLRFLRGDFTYEESGPLDSTHLRFFTFHSADRFLLARSGNLRLELKIAHGSFPLWWGRRYVLSDRLCASIDRWACRHWPNLFADQVLMKAAMRGIANPAPR